MKNISSLFDRYRYELIAFLTSGVLLSTEITGGRLLAPYFGLSSYVWTAMIGTILCFLSLGYWLGGRAADRGDPKRDLGVIIAAGGILLLASNLLTDPVLSTIDNLSVDLRLSALLAAAALFGPASLLIGFISPHLAKLRVTSLKTSGESIGRLEAASALGSIFGTFVSGYILLGYFGSRDIGLALAVALLLTSFLAESRRLRWIRFGVIFASLLLLMTPRSDAYTLIDTDSSHARYKVTLGLLDGKPARFLLTDGQSIQSGVFVDEPDEIALGYAKKIDEILQNRGKDIPSLAVIGGGAHTLPRQLAKTYSIERAVSVEVDKALDKIARDYFYFSEDRVEAIYQDGRAFLARSDERFDLVIMDAFSAVAPPFHLTTKEANADIARLLNRGGLFISNVISNYPDGLLPSLVATQKKQFESVIVLPSGDSLSRSGRQNFIVVAGAAAVVGPLEQTYLSQIVEISGGEVLTDDYAPIERLTY